MTITQNEKAVLRAISENYFLDGGDPVETWIWSDCINDSSKPSGITGKALSGVISSLSQKGLIVADGAGKDACVKMTVDGEKALYLNK